MSMNLWLLFQDQYYPDSLLLFDERMTLRQQYFLLNLVFKVV